MPKIKSKKKVLFCAAEATPLAKVGGLADVVGSLPAALKSQQIEARVLMPAHGSIMWRGLRAKSIATFYVVIGGQRERVVVREVRVQGVHYYLLVNKKYFSGNVYDGDNISKYLFFCRAALVALSYLPFSPAVIHAHDFHAAPIITELAVRKRRPGLILTIHNLQHQGWTDIATLKAFGFQETSFLGRVNLGKDNQTVNLLAAGIATADKITTVSATYAREILTSAYGQGLDKLLRSRRRDLVGIVNGIDVNDYNPETDRWLVDNYTSLNLTAGKQVNKKAVFSYFGWQEDGSPLLAFIARFSSQKGLDLFAETAWRQLAQRYAFKLVLLGSGEKKYENIALSLQSALPANIRTVVAFDNALARNLYAAADYFLVPSQFEPCGLTQMMAMRYGAVPIVRATGGLKDTVKHGQTGLTFSTYTIPAFTKIVEQALRLYYRQPKKFQALRLAGRRQDWSWSASAPAYRRLYDLV